MTLKPIFLASAVLSLASLLSPFASQKALAEETLFCLGTDDDETILILDKSNDGQFSLSGTFTREDGSTIEFDNARVDNLVTGKYRTDIPTELELGTELVITSIDTDTRYVHSISEGSFYDYSRALEFELVRNGGDTVLMERSGSYGVIYGGREDGQEIVEMCLAGEWHN